MKRLTASGYRKMPWKNGGGTTTELVIEPEQAALGGGAAERFLYRVSIADVASDGPFSRFPGYDRHIALVSGAGMTLDGGDAGRFALTSGGPPVAFSGDWDIHGTLIAGAVRDFNLIVDRARATSSLELRDLAHAEPLAAGSGETAIVHVLEGALADASTHDTLVVAPGESISLEPGETGWTRLAVARVRRLAR